MPPPLAAFLTFCFIVFLFRRDLKDKTGDSRALWIPFWWTVIACSRDVTAWCAIIGIPVPGGSLQEGSPADRLVYIVMIVAGVRILRRRHLRIAAIAQNNKWLVVFLIYCFLAIIWSDYPFVSLKRWIKVVGHPVMALIVLTDRDSEKALIILMKRSAYILIPISVLFIKYFPEYGRSFSFWTGAAYNTGITSNKNLLGVNCLIFGYFFIWYFLETLRLPRDKHRLEESGLCILFFGMNWWLLSMADSKTPLVALIVGTVIILLVRAKWVNKRLVGTYLIAGVIFIVLAESVFGIYEVVLDLLGREANLTERTVLWEDLFEVDINPLLGAGFESFWLGDRLEELWEKHPWRPNQAHNGYFETYLNLGVVGLFLLIGLLLATFRKATRLLSTDLHWGLFRLGFLCASIVYNWTEAGFKTVHPIFFIFYIIAIDVPAGAFRADPPASAAPPPGGDRDPAAPLGIASRLTMG